MDKLKAIFTSASFSLLTLSCFSQNPNHIDPGNVRGDEGTTYLWGNPTYYIPVLAIAVLLVAFGIYRRTKKKG
jgi:hypothetical protein